MSREFIIRKTDISGDFVPLRELTTVIAVAKVGGVTKAAEALGYAQPTVTLHIQTLERYIGSPLFERIGRKLAITPIGRAAVERGSRLLEDAGKFRSSLLDPHRELSGTVRLAAIEPTASLRLPSIVARIAQSHPDITVSVQAAGSPAAAEMVRSHEVDLAICSPPRGDKKLRYRPLFDEPLALLVPRKHRFAHAKNVAVSDLVSEKVLVSDEGCAYRALLRSALDAGHVEVALEASFGTISTLPYGVAAGLGIAVVPQASLQRPLPGTNLVPLRKPALSLPVGMLTAADRVLPEAATRVLETLVQALQSR